MSNTIHNLPLSVILFLGETSVWNPKTVYFSRVKERMNANPSPAVDLERGSVTIFKRAPHCQEGKRAWTMFFWLLTECSKT